MSEAQNGSLLILGERRRGRPRVEEPQERLSTRIPTPEYDRLVKLAQKRDQSLSALVRDLLAISRRRHFPS
jgi:hypothetical protein